MRRTKLPAFTILEVVIVMLLVSVVIAMVYTVFHMVKSYELRMTDQNRAQNKFLLASNAFGRDVERATYLKVGQDSALVCLNGQEEISYIVRDSLLIRENSETRDTMLIAPAIKLSFTFVENRNHPWLVESATLCLSDTLGRNSYISGRKIYSSASLFNMPQNATD